MAALTGPFDLMRKQTEAMPGPFTIRIPDEDIAQTNDRFVLLSDNSQSSQLQEEKTIQKPASSDSFLSGIASYTACAIGLAVSNSLAIDRIVPSLIGRGICLSNLIPTSVLKSYLSWTRATAMIPS